MRQDAKDWVVELLQLVPPDDRPRACDIIWNIMGSTLDEAKEKIYEDLGIKQ